MRLNKTQRRLVLELAFFSSLTTGRWREFVPLANRGLVAIDDHDSRSLASMFGASMRTVEPTGEGRALAVEMMSDASLWQKEAHEHALRQQRLEEKRRCSCVSCLTARRMRPTND